MRMDVRGVGDGIRDEVGTSRQAGQYRPQLLDLNRRYIPRN